MWGNWALCGNFATNMNFYGGGKFMIPQVSGKLGDLERGLGASCVFARLVKRFEKDLRVRTRRRMLKSISYFFCACNRPSVKYLYEQNSNTTRKEFRREKRTVSIGLIFREVKCVAFGDMQQMSHDHSMFFATFYIDSCCGRGLEKLVDYSGQKKLTLNFPSECLLSRALDNCSRTEMNCIFKSCWLLGFPLKY